jgi:ATP-dependent Lon protease
VSTPPLPDDLAEAFRALPLFPLPQVVLFPGVLLPLHVFEPRYRALVRDVMATHRSFGLPRIVDPGSDMGQSPPIAEVTGVGTIVEHAELPGGRCNIVVLGRARARIQELSFAPPYRRAIAQPLRSVGSAEVPDVEVAALHAAVTAFTRLLRESDEAFKLRLPREAPHGIVADACAHQLVLDARDRQALLETLDVRERIRRLTEILTVQRATLAPPSGGLLH